MKNMERRKFIQNCCYIAIGVPTITSVLESCGTIYYASVISKENKLTVAKSEFLKVKKSKKVSRKFVLVKTETLAFPICLYQIEENNYVASLLKCTHQACELNVGGDIYTCPCHGSEFSNTGKVLEGPAIENLKTYKVETDNENIYIYLS